MRLFAEKGDPSKLQVVSEVQMHTSSFAKARIQHISFDTATGAINDKLLNFNSLALNSAQGIKLDAVELLFFMRLDQWCYLFVIRCAKV